VYGRVLGAGEIKRMIATENIIRWYNERAASDNWATWNKSNPEKAHALDQAARIARDDGE